MRIIDRQNDFYDYLQDPTDTLVFDRRKSFLLDKKRICEAMHKCNRFRNCSHYLITIQCGAVFWLFLATITEFDKGIVVWREPKNYELKLLFSWKNYDVKSRPIRVAVHECDLRRWNKKTSEYVISYDDIRNDTKLYNSIHDGGEDCSTLKSFPCAKNGWREVVYDFPILRGIGVSNFIDPVEIFCAIEEHFSRAKTASERTEPIGITNDDKIIMHGFDTKTSFRGK